MIRLLWSILEEIKLIDSSSATPEYALQKHVTSGSPHSHGLYELSTLVNKGLQK